MQVTNEMLFKQLNSSLLSSTNNLTEIINRLSTGFKVNSAKDSPASYAVITDLKTKISSLDVAHDNIEHGINVLTITEETLVNITDLLERIRELALTACNGTYDSDTLNAIQEEINYCTDQIQNLNNSLQYDGVDLFQKTYNLDKNKSYFIPHGAILEEVPTAPISLAILDDSEDLNQSNSLDNQQNTSNQLAKNLYIEGNIESTAPNSTYSLMKTRTLAMASEPPIEDPELNPSLELAANEELEVEINGAIYKFINNTSDLNSISYTFNVDTNELIIDGGNFTLESADSSDKNIVVNGSGDLSINLGDSNNNLIVNSSFETTISLGNGNNNVYVDGIADITLGTGINIIDLESDSQITALQNANITISTLEGKSIELDIEGKQYLLENSTSMGIVSNPDTITFNGDSLKITTLLAQSNNIILNSDSINYIDTIGVSTVTSLGKNISLELLNNSSNIVNLNGENSSITTGNGDNNLTINGKGATISTGSGADTINVNGTSANIISGDGNDSIIVKSTSAIIDTGLGDDYISVSSAGTSANIISGIGNDTVISNATSAIIDLGAGDNNLTSTGKSSTITVGDGNNTIISSGSTSTLTVGNGNNSINISGTSAILTTGDGDNVVDIGGNYVTVTTGSGTDTINVNGTNANIISGDGNDSIIVKSTSAIIDTGLGDDYISVSSAGTSANIISGIGNDTVISNATSAIIDLGAGDNNLTSTGKSSTITVGDGNNTIISSGSTSTLTVGNGNNSINISGTSAILTTGDGDNVVDIGGNYVTVTTGSGTDTITVTGTNAKVDVAEGNDEIIVKGANNRVFGASGDNYISLAATATGSTVYSGMYYNTSNPPSNTNNGSNTIIVDANNVDINLDNSSNNLTINGDNNYVYTGNNNNTITINGDSNTVNNNQTSNTTVIDNGVNNTSFNKVGEAAVLPNSGVLEIRAGENFDININGKIYTIQNTMNKTGTLTYNYDSVNDIITFEGVGGTYSQSGSTWKHNGETLNITAKAGQDDRVILNGSFGEVRLGDGDDYVESNINRGKVYTEAGADTLIIKEGSENASTRGTFLDFDTGSGDDSIEVQEGANFVRVQGRDDNDTINVYSSYTYAYGGNGNDTLNNYSYLQTDTRLYGESGNDSLNEYGKFTRIYGGVGNDDITVHAYNSDSSIETYSQVYGDAGDDIITINGKNSYYAIRGGEGNDTFNINAQVNSVLGYSGDDKFIIKDGLTTSQIGMLDGGADNDTIETTLNINSLNKVSIEGYNDKLANSGYISLVAGQEYILDFGDYKYTVKNNYGAENSFSYSFNPTTKAVTFNGALFLEIRAGEGQVDNVTLSYAKDTVVYLGDQDDKISLKNNANTYYSNNTIYAGDGNDILDILCGNTNIYGEGGDDTINMNSSTSYTYKNEDGYTVSGGAGKDTINVNTTGNTGTFDGGDDDDIINVNAQNYNAIVKGGNGNDTLHHRLDTKGSEFETIYRNTASTNSCFNIDANVLTNVYINGKLYQFFSESAQKIYAHHQSDGQLYLKMNATTVTAMEEANQNIRLVGNDNTYNGNNYINTISVEGNNNIINGGNNNDVITITSGNYNKIYGNDGNDTVTQKYNFNSIYTGAGNDIINLRATNGTTDVIDAGVDNDTINIYNGHSSGLITGSDGDDIINIKSSNNLNIQTGVGNDTVNIEGDNNKISATSGTKNLKIIGDGNNFTGSTDSDIVQINGSSNNIQTNSADDIITIVSGSENNINTGDGNNIVTIQSSNNNITMGNDDDILYLEASNDNSYNINTGAGNDSIVVSGNENLGINTGDGDDTIIDKGNNNSFVNQAGNDILNSLGAQDSKITGIDNIVISEEQGSFIVTEANKSIEVTMDGVSYTVKTNNNDTEVSYLKSDEGLELSVNNSEINTLTGKISNLTVVGSGNKVNLADSYDTTLTINGDSNTIESGTGNYDITINGANNAANLTEGVGYVEISDLSDNVTINGNNSDTTILNLGSNVILNNCDFLIKAVDDIKVQAGINSSDKSQITLPTGFMVGRLSFNVTTEAYANASIEKADALIEKVTKQITEIGAQYSRLSLALEANEIEQMNYKSSKSTLEDADIAELTSQYVRNLIIQQASSILSVTVGNFHTESVMKLLYNIK